MSRFGSDKTRRRREVMATRTNDAPAIRELFVEELAEVKGGNPIEWLCEKVFGGCYTTQACCEEGPDNCCADHNLPA